MGITVSSAFDSGNIELVAQAVDGTIELAIRPDHNSEFLQWFHFRLSGAKGKPCRLRVVNAGSTSYPAGWQAYNVPTSYNRCQWFRTPAMYDGKHLEWSLTPDSDAVYFAYFVPYSLERHADLLARCQSKPGVRLERLGSTLDGRDLDCLHIESHAGSATQTRPQIWSIARQHPGESMAEWWMEGWLERLLDEDDAAARALRSLADIHVVPNMNPDGSFRGHLRTNAAGVNLNREWQAPALERSPEVFHVKHAMQRSGVNLCFDVHGDEALPYCFIVGAEGIPGWNDTRDAELQAFKHTLASLNPDFQTAHGYPRKAPGSAQLTYCTNHVAETWACPAFTLEMPFKDTHDTPRPDTGWSPARAAKLGSAFVEAALLLLQQRLIEMPSRKSS